ncbi:hypothetical protein C8J57DRAFT_1510918 [Mycena rebaudengoi]|nr:hypothetical protein C8J57DRAFT_1510918 [Mycena rebaudengoi]
MLDPVAIALRVRSALHRRRGEEPTTGAFHNMVAATLRTVNAPLRSALNDAATPARISGGGEAEAGNNASPHSAGHTGSGGSGEGGEANDSPSLHSGGHAPSGGSGEVGEVNVNAAPPSGSSGMEGHTRSGGLGRNEGPQAQYFIIANSVVNVTTSGGIGGPGGAGLFVGGRGGDGGGASMLGVPPPTRYSTDDTSLGTALFADGDGVHAVQEQVVTRRSIDIHPTPPSLPAHLASTVDDAALETVGGHSETGEGPVNDIHAQTTTTPSISIRSTPLPLRPARIVDDAALGTPGGDGETGEGPAISVQAPVIADPPSILHLICS